MNLKRNMIPALVVATILSFSMFSWAATKSIETIAQKSKKGKSNVLLIVADDLGFCDIGAFGGEIETPNLDTLAKSGIRMSNFHVMPTCSPTRAALLSGTDNHLAGVGSMAETLTSNQRGAPGYEGYLNDRVVCLASLLKDAGYHTYMAGKWHLGWEEDQSPAARGFEKSFVLLHGGASHWDDMLGLTPEDPFGEYRKDGKLVDRLPEGFYSSEFYTDQLIDYINVNRSDDRPFFAYLAYTVPHNPLHAPDQWLEKYRGRYDAGYDALREQRLTRMKALGLIPEETIGYPRVPNVPAWNTLSDREKQISAREMETYAAMVDNMDFHIGRIMDYLKKIGEYDDTLVLFFSDNGASGHGIKAYPGQDMKWVNRTFNNSLENYGRKGSFVAYGPAWGQVGMTPFRLFKGSVAEGGIRSPFIAAGAGITERKLSSAFAHVTDIAPTILELAGVEHPEDYNGRNVLPMRGASMLEHLQGRKAVVHSKEMIAGVELFGSKALLQGHWKALFLAPPWGKGQNWELFNLTEDPAELNDVAAENPDRLKEMIKQYERYAKDVGVVSPDFSEFLKRTKIRQ
jgi:arylsulfatase A-like enzyme